MMCLCSCLLLRIFKFPSWCLLLSIHHIIVYYLISRYWRSLFFILLFISNFNPLWSDRIQGSISIFLYLVIVVLWHKIWSILEKDPCAAENKVYSFFVGWYILYKSVKSKLLIMLLRSVVSLFIFIWKIYPVMREVC